MVLKNIIIYRNAEVKYYYDSDIKLIESEENLDLDEIDYVIVEDKTRIGELSAKYGYEKILKDLLFHDFYLNRAIKYKEFGIINNDISVVSNWCGGGFIYNIFATSSNGPCVWGYTSNIDSYINEVNSETYFTEEIYEMDRINNVPIGKMGNTQINYNHYKEKQFDEIIDIHNARRKKFNRNKFFTFSVAYDIDTLNKLLNIKGTHVILTNLEVTIKNVISVNNFQMRIWNSKSDELWKYAQRYLTTDFNLIDFLNDSVVKKMNVDINDYRIDVTENIFDYYDNGSDKLIVVFNGSTDVIHDYGNRDYVSKLRNKQCFVEIKENKDNNYLFIQDSFSELYGFYIQHFNHLIFWNLNDKLSEFIIKNKFDPQNVTAIGNSKGATAALLYSINNENIGNSFVINPILDFVEYFEKNNYLVFQHLKYYSKEMMKLFNFDNSTSQTNIKMVLAIGAQQINNQIDFAEKIRNTKNFNLSTEIEINGHNDSIFPVVEKTSILSNILLFSSGTYNKINSNFVEYSNNFEVVDILNRYRNNINKEDVDILVLSDQKELILITNYNVIEIQIEMFNIMHTMNKISRNVYLIPLSNYDNNYVKLLYKYADRTKEIHKNINKSV